MLNRLVVFVCLLIAASPVIATSVEATVEAGVVTHCAWYLNASATPTVIAVTTPTTCRYPLSVTLPAGNHTVTAEARRSDPLWGTVSSPKSAPLAFTKPAATGAPPSNLVLVP